MTELELDLNFLKTQFDVIQKTLREMAFMGTEVLKQYADERIKKVLLKLEEKIVQEIQQNIEFASKYSPKEIKAFAHEILRREHIQYLSSLYPKEGIKKTFDKYTSTQVPIGEFRNCYHRWGTNQPDPNNPHDPTKVGLSAFRVHTLKKDDEILIKYYHHSSPVVYEEHDFEKSIEATDANLRQAVRETGGGPLTEIRLLSTNKGPGGDYKQAVATYLSAIRVSTPEAPVTVFFYGVNLARYSSLTKLLPFEIPGYSGGLQTFINTRSTNELFEKTFKQLDIIGSDLTKIKEKRKTLDIQIKNINLSNGEAAVEKELCNLLREHHQYEKALLQEYKTMQKKPLQHPDPEKQKINEEIRQDINTVMKLMQNNRYLKPKYNGQLQATLVRLNTRLGENVATGCNDAKDRDGMVSIVVEANEIYRDRHRHYPDITAEGKNGSIIRKELREIQDWVCQHSSPARVAEFVSWPELAKGLDNTNAPRSGFGHLPNDGTMAGYFKKIHGHHPQPLPFEYKHKAQVIPQNKWASHEPNPELHVASTHPKKRDPGKIQKIITLEDDTISKKFIHIDDPKMEDLDAKAPHRIEVCEHEVRYQATKMPDNPDLLEKIVEQVVTEAINKFRPGKVEDLHFSGNTQLQKLAKDIAAEKLGLAKSHTSAITHTPNSVVANI